MSATTELLAARWNDGLPVSGGPGINNLEAVIKLITGIPFATVITRGLGLDVESRFTGQVWMKSSGAGSGNGLRLQDTSGGGRDWLMFPSGDQIFIYENTGTEATPVWTARSSIHRYGIASGLGCSAYTTALALTPSVTNIIPLPNEVYDAGGFHDGVTNNSRFTIPMSGYYRPTMIVSAGTGLLDPTISILKNGSSVEWSVNIPGSSKSINYVFPVMYMVAGAYYEFRINDTNGCASGTCHCSMECLRTS